MLPSEFLSQLFAHVENKQERFVGISAFPSRKTAHVKLTALGAADVEAAGRQLQEDVYFSVGLRGKDLGQHKRGGSADVVALPCLFLDVDVGTVGHKATNCPPTLEEAIELVEAVLPPCTAAVDSGGGLHFYWQLETSIEIRSAVDRAHAEKLSKAWQDIAVRAAKERGWHLDNTGDLARVLRLPGTLNRKVETQIRPVVVLDFSGPKYLIGDLDKVALGAVRSTEDTRSSAPPSEAPVLPASVERPAASATGTIDANEVRRRLGAVAGDKVNPKTDLSAKQIAELILTRAAFGTLGKRDDTIHQACSIVAFVAPEASTDVLMAVLKPSLDATAATGPCEIPPWDNALGKLGRALQTKRAEQQRDDDVADGIFGVQPSVDSRLAQMLEDAGAANEDELTHRWIVINGATYYLLTKEGYGTARHEKELPAALRDAFESNTQVNLTRHGENGVVIRRSPGDLVAAYGVVADKIVSSMSAKRASFNPLKRTFTESVCRILPIEPHYDERINEWLTLLGGDQADKLLDWVATVTRLEQQTCAIVLTGPSSTGKTLFAKGLSRLWREGGPTELQRIVDNFNADLLNCPLVFADEKLPAQLLKSGNASTTLRELIGSGARTISRKHLSNTELVGAIRLIIAAQNEDVLAFDEKMTQADYDAVAGRFLYVHTPQAAADYIQSIGGFDALMGWVEQDQIAAHALWLRDHREVAAGNRFAVQGDIHKVRRLLTTHNRMNNLCCEWLAKYLAEPNSNIGKTMQIHIGNGKILVNAPIMQTHWQHYIQQHEIPSLQRIGHALENIGGAAYRIGQLDYRAIYPAYVLDWAAEQHVGSVEAMRRRIDQEMPGIVAVELPKNGNGRVLN